MACQDLAKQFLKLLKTEQGELRPLTIAVLLVIAHMPRFETQALDFLKHSLVESLSDAHQRAKSRWLEEMYEERRGPCEDHVMGVVAACKNSWEVILPALVQLGVQLADLTAGRNGSETPQSPTYSTQIPRLRFVKQTDLVSRCSHSCFSKVAMLGARCLISCSRA